jgi:hypothetical protein
MWRYSSVYRVGGSSIGGVDDENVRILGDAPDDPSPGQRRGRGWLAAAVVVGVGIFAVSVSLDRDASEDEAISTTPVLVTTTSVAEQVTSTAGAPPSTTTPISPDSAATNLPGRVVLTQPFSDTTILVLGLPEGGTVMVSYASDIDLSSGPVTVGVAPFQNGPDVRTEGDSGLLLITVDDCARMSRLGGTDYTGRFFAFCDESSDTLFLIYGSPEVHQRVHETLMVISLNRRSQDAFAQAFGTDERVCVDVDQIVETNDPVMAGPDQDVPVVNVRSGEMVAGNFLVVVGKWEESNNGNMKVFWTPLHGAIAETGALTILIERLDRDQPPYTLTFDVMATGGGVLFWPTGTRFTEPGRYRLTATAPGHWACFETTV